MSVVFAALIINILAAYGKSLIDKVLGHLFARRRERQRQELERRLSMVTALKRDFETQMVVSITGLRTMLSSVLVLCGSTTAFFFMVAMPATRPVSRVSFYVGASVLVLIAVRQWIRADWYFDLVADARRAGLRPERLKEPAPAPDPSAE
jgi:hypothetical protein